MLTDEEKKDILKECRYDIYTTLGDSAVRITHLPTGIREESKEHRSKFKNTKLAEERLFDTIEEFRRIPEVDS